MCLSNGGIMDEQTKQLKMESLEKVVREYLEDNDKFKLMEKKQKQQKDTIKNMMFELDIKDVSIPELGQVALQIIDNSSLDMNKVLAYFKTREHYFEFIHTSEYVDENEIAMAIANGRIDAKELAPFIVHSQTSRIMPYRHKKSK